MLHSLNDIAYTPSKYYHLGLEQYIEIGSFVTGCTNNPNLFCIDVDDVAWATANWTASNFPQSIEATMSFGVNCNPSSIQEYTTNKKLLKVTDLLGRKTKGTQNEVLFYIYDDGAVEKRMVIE